MTPLVDVVLVLLIIFMVVTPMLTRGVKVELPEAAHYEKKQDNGTQIVVSVAESGQIYIDQQVMDVDGLADVMRQELSHHKGEGGQRDVHVKADKRLKYGVVRKVLEQIHAAGARSVAVATEDKVAEGSK